MEVEHGAGKMGRESWQHLQHTQHRPLMAAHAAQTRYATYCCRSPRSPPIVLTPISCHSTMPISLPTRSPDRQIS
jgi:hypothetical protein